MGSTVDVAARFVQFSGAVVLFGAPLFFLYGLRVGKGRTPTRFGWPPWMLPLAAAATAAAAVASLSAQTAVMTDDPAAALQPGPLWDVLSGTKYGHAVAVRIVLAVAALFAGAVVRPGRGLWVLLAGLGGGVLASFAWTGHGAADGVLHLGADIIHLLAAGVWLGALAVLAAQLAARGRRADAFAVRALHRSLEGFSGIGTSVVALLILTGLVNSWFLIGPNRIGLIFQTAYGLLLTAKVVVFAGMLGLAALNRFRLTPALGAAVDDEAPQAALAALQRSIVLETSAALAVLALVSLLGTLEPPAAME